MGRLALGGDYGQTGIGWRLWADWYWNETKDELASVFIPCLDAISKSSEYESPLCGPLNSYHCVVILCMHAVIAKYCLYDRKLAGQETDMAAVLVFNSNN